MKNTKKIIKETKASVKEYKEKYFKEKYLLDESKTENDINEAVKNLFEILSWKGRILFWYWHYRTMLWSLKENENNSKR